MRREHGVLHNPNNSVCPVSRAGAMGSFSRHHPMWKSRGRGRAGKEGREGGIDQVRSPVCLTADLCPVQPGPQTRKARKETHSKRVGL